MKIKLLLLCISLFPNYTNAAQFCLGQYKKKLLPSAAFSSKTIVAPLPKPLFCQALVGGNFDIIFSICVNYENLEDAAKTVNVLAQTSKFLNTLINDSNRTLTLIKNLSLRFNCSNMAVTEKLYTKEANRRYLLQKQFNANWTGGSATIEGFHRLKSMGLDLNFTFGGNSYSPLLRNVIWQEIGYAQVGKWIIENGADINVVDPNGSSALMLALDKNNRSLIPLFLEHDSLKIHYQDSNGNTLLHYCVKKVYRRGLYGVVEENLEQYEYMLTVIKQLLAKKIDPTIKNKDGKTVLDLALEITHSPIIDVLKEAITRFS